MGEKVLKVFIEGKGSPQQVLRAACADLFLENRDPICPEEWKAVIRAICEAACILGWTNVIGSIYHHKKPPLTEHQLNAILTQELRRKLPWCAAHDCPKFPEVMELLKGMNEK